MSLRTIPEIKEGTYRAKASGTLPNGKPVVVNSDGTVGVVEETSVTQSVGSPTVFESAGVIDTSATFDSSSNRVVIAYRDTGNSNYGTAVVGTVSGTSISFGTPTVFDSVYVTDTSAAFDSNESKVVISYQNLTTLDRGTAVVGTVSSTSISFGSPTVFTTNSVSDTSATFDSNENKVVIAYRDQSNSNYGTAIVGTVSGTSISFGTSVVFRNDPTDKIATTFDSSNNKVVAIGRLYSLGGGGFAVVGTVSGSSISFGSDTNFETNGVDGPSIDFDSVNNKVVISYQDQGNNYGTAIVGTVSGTSISFGTKVVFESASINRTSITFDSDAGKSVIFYRDGGNSNYGTLIVGTVSGTSISFGTAVVFESANTFSIQSTFDSNESRVGLLLIAMKVEWLLLTKILATLTTALLSFSATPLPLPPSPPPTTSACLKGWLM